MAIVDVHVYWTEDPAVVAVYAASALSTFGGLPHSVNNRKKYLTIVIVELNRLIGENIGVSLDHWMKHINLTHRILRSLKDWTGVLLYTNMFGKDTYCLCKYVQ